MVITISRRSWEYGRPPLLGCFSSSRRVPSGRRVPVGKSSIADVGGITLKVMPIEMQPAELAETLVNLVDGGDIPVDDSVDG